METNQEAPNGEPKAAASKKSDIPSSIAWKDPKYVVTVIKDKKHPRYDPRIEMALNKETIETMKTPGIGVLENVLVERDGVSEDGKVNLTPLDGRRRTLHWEAACKEIEEENEALVKEGKEPHPFPRLPIRLAKTRDDDHAKQIATVANIHRDDDPAVVRAKHAFDMLEAGEKDEKGEPTEANKEKVRVAFRMPSQEALDRLLSLLKLDKKVQTLVTEGKLPATSAAILAKDVPKAEQLAAAQKLIAEGAATVRGTRKATAKKKATAKGKKGSKQEHSVPGKRELAKAILGVEAARKRTKSDISDARLVGHIMALQWVLNGDDSEDVFVKAVEEGKKAKEKAAPV